MINVRREGEEAVETGLLMANCCCLAIKWRLTISQMDKHLHPLSILPLPAKGEESYRRKLGGPTVWSVGVKPRSNTNQVICFNGKQSNKLVG